MRKSAPAARAVTAIALVLVILTAAGAPAAVASAALQSATASPGAGETDSGGLANMLGHLPDLPLGENGAMVTYADVARQTAVLGVTPPRDATDAAGQERWRTAVGTLLLPQSTSRNWAYPPWRETFGFDLFDVVQAAEYAAPPFGVTVVRGTFDPVELRAAWARAGYQPIDLGAGEAYAVREDYAMGTDLGSQMALVYLNVVALADDGTLVLSSARDGVRGALAAIAGRAPSFADRGEVAPLVRSAPPTLVSALLMHGEALRALPDPASALFGDDPLADMEDFATRAADELAEARRMPPVTAALLGQTAGAPATDTAATATADLPHPPPARLVAVLTTIAPEAAEAAAGVIVERLATRQAAGLDDQIAGRTWAALFPERTVRVLPEDRAVLVELVPAPGVPPTVLHDLLFTRALDFLAWDL